MSLAAPISNIEVRRATPALVGGWSEVHPTDLLQWNNLLRRSDASLYQYPFWNEPYRRMLITPRYLAWGTQRNPVAFAAMLTLGFGPAKIGLVFRGPAQLFPGTRLPRSIFRDLLAWARYEGYMFLRFTHSDPEILSQIAAAGTALDLDAFPYLVDFPVLTQDYIVSQKDTEEETLAGFDREARRKIRRGEQAGYEFHANDDPNALAAHWPLYRDCAERKHFRLERPLSFYSELMRSGQFHNRARLYSVSRNGETVGSTLVLRDRTTAHCLLAAFHPEHRSSAAWLHWRAMRDMYRLGTSEYNMGPGPGSLARFKSGFCPNPVRYPAPLTMVLKPAWFQLWGKAFLPMAKQLQPVLRRIAFQRAALSRAVAQAGSMSLVSRRASELAEV